MRKNTNEDGLPIEMDVSKLAMGDVIDIFPYDGACKRHGTDEVLAEFTLKTPVLLDSRAVHPPDNTPLLLGNTPPHPPSLNWTYAYVAVWAARRTGGSGIQGGAHPPPASLRPVPAPSPSPSRLQPAAV